MPPRDNPQPGNLLRFEQRRDDRTIVGGFGRLDTEAFIGHPARPQLRPTGLQMRLPEQCRQPPLGPLERLSIEPRQHIDDALLVGARQLHIN